MRLGRGALAVLAVASAGVGSVAVATPTSVDDAASAARGAARVDPPARELTVVATGDILTEASVRSSAAAAANPGERFRFDPMFAPIAGIVAWADLAICHAEIPIGDPGGPVGIVGTTASGVKLSLAPHELAGALARAGYDRCSTASNHSFDQGAVGIATTLGALDSVGIGHVGTARTPDEAVDRPFDVAGVSVGHVSTTRYVNTGLPGEPWRMNFVRDVSETIADVAALRAAGAEIVIVSLHVGFEMTASPWPADLTFVDRLTRDAAVDLVVMHGPHVVHGVERVNGTPVFWSLGNLVSGMGVPGRGRHSDPRALDGLIATVTFSERSTGGFDATFDAIGICNERSARTVRPVVTELQREQIPPWLRAELEACQARLTGVVPDLS